MASEDDLEQSQLQVVEIIDNSYSQNQLQTELVPISMNSYDNKSSRIDDGVSSPLIETTPLIVSNFSFNIIYVPAPMDSTCTAAPLPNNIQSMDKGTA